MAYSRLFKVVQNFVLGFQQLNQARDNEEAVRDAYEAEHDSSDEHSIFAGPIAYGRHNHVTIARGAGYVQVLSFNPFTGTPLVSPTYRLKDAHGRGLGDLTRQDVGLYSFELIGADASTVWLEGVPVITSSTEIRMVRCTYSPGWGVGNFGATAMVRTFERNSTTGEFELADYDFGLTYFSR